MTVQAAYGSWISPITAELIVSRSIGLGSVHTDGLAVYWLESRPTEGGRTVLVRLGASGEPVDLTPAPYNVRTRVHEYGGGAYTVHDGTVYFVHFADGRFYRLAPGGEPEAFTPEGYRYADAVKDPARGVLYCVREEHGEAGVLNTLVRLDPEVVEAGTVLVSGEDFYASPRLSPDGDRLAWLSWNHPNMPWDGTRLWVADISPNGDLMGLRQVAGGKPESIFQPEWSPGGVLHFVSDRTGWWNLYAWNEDESGESARPLYPCEAEFGLPQWVFGMSTYAFWSGTQVLCTYREQGVTHLAMLDGSGGIQPIELPYTEINGPAILPGAAVFVAASPTEPAALIRLELTDGRWEVLRRSSLLEIDPGYLALPEAITFPTTGGRSAHGFYYPPRNRDYAQPTEERPPLLVKSHGGPTAATSSAFNLKIQYWTSRGIAVLDVDYRGSTGYGRAYREELNDQWGIADVDDCVAGAEYLVRRGDVDGNRLAIDGGSAGGFTTLAALVFRDVFKAGASYYGVSDLESLARDTHKFESRYLDRLVGPYPERRDLYIERSPIYHVEKLTCPIIFFQGLEDRVVPPEQAETMVRVLESRGIPVAYLPFEGEQHGFRRAENIKRALEAEFYFFSRVFDFEPADEIDPVPIEHLKG